MDFLNFLWLKYQYAMWLMSLTAGEYGKIGRFVNEFLLLLTFLSVRNIKITKKQAAIAYSLIVIIAIFVGVFLKDIGTVKINNDIANQQNPQMIQIQEDLKLIKEKWGIK